MLAIFTILLLCSTLVLSLKLIKTRSELSDMKENFEIKIRGSVELARRDIRSNIDKTILDKKRILQEGRQQLHDESEKIQAERAQLEHDKSEIPKAIALLEAEKVRISLRTNARYYD